MRTTSHETSIGLRARLPPALLRVFFAALGALSGVTFTWVVWGILTPGDYFGNGSLAFILATLGAGGVLGGWTAYRTRSRRLRIAVLASAILCTVFWLGVPSGWWAKGP
jgi:hypothetical protein